MYVRLKHTLSALALDALERPAQGDVVRWLVAYCDLVDSAPDGARFRQPLAAVAARARAGSRVISPPAWIEDHGLLERIDGALSVPEGFRPHFAYMDRQTHRLQAALRALARRRTGGVVPRGRAAIMRKAAALFNNGLFFECHEFLETVWRTAPEADRGFYHGVILIAAAFYHHEKGNLHGTRIKLVQGMKHLRPYPPRYQGVRLDRWLKALEPWRERSEAGQISGVLTPGEIPRIPHD